MRRRRLSSLPLVAAAVVAFSGVYALSEGNIVGDATRLFTGETSAQCNIKGNVSIDTGERIYHVPGQRYYDETVIASQYGERYFCSEAEARAAGWRRSRV